MLIFRAPVIIRCLFLSWFLQIGLLPMHLLTACCLNLALCYMSRSLKAEFASVCSCVVAFLVHVTLDMRTHLPYTLVSLERVQAYINLSFNHCFKNERSSGFLLEQTKGLQCPYFTVAAWTPPTEMHNGTVQLMSFALLWMLFTTMNSGQPTAMKFLSGLPVWWSKGR